MVGSGLADPAQGVVRLGCQNPAGFLEQLFFAAGPEDQVVDGTDDLQRLGGSTQGGQRLNPSEGASKERFASVHRRATESIGVGP